MILILGFSIIIITTLIVLLLLENEEIKGLKKEIDCMDREIYDLIQKLKVREK